MNPISFKCGLLDLLEFQPNQIDGFLFKMGGKRIARLEETKVEIANVILFSAPAIYV